jgi:hypothetical protein
MLAGTLTTDPDEYVEFLRTVFERLAKPAPVHPLDLT